MYLKMYVFACKSIINVSIVHATGQTLYAHFHVHFTTVTCEAGNQLLQLGSSQSPAPSSPITSSSLGILHHPMCGMMQYIQCC